MPLDYTKLTTERLFFNILVSMVKAYYIKHEKEPTKLFIPESGLEIIDRLAAESKNIDAGDKNHDYRKVFFGLVVIVDDDFRVSE